MSKRPTSLAVAIVLSCVAGTAPGQATEEAGDTPGIGPSALAGVTQFHANGDYSVLAAGLGAGLSYKWRLQAKRRTPGPWNEAGLYVVPQISSATENGKEVTRGSAALVLHVKFFQQFGIGLGYRVWDKGVGFGLNHGKDRLFVTLGLGLTNNKSGAEPARQPPKKDDAKPPGVSSDAKTERP